MGAWQHQDSNPGSEDFKPSVLPFVPSLYLTITGGDVPLDWISGEMTRKLGQVLTTGLGSIHFAHSPRGDVQVPSPGLNFLC